jgi:hypothetical protein
MRRTAPAKTPQCKRPLNRETLQQTSKTGIITTKTFPHELFQLESKLSTPPTNSQLATYHSIWEQQRQIRQEAEKHCRKLNMGADPWSLKLQILRDKINVWKLVIKKKRSGKVSSRLLRHQTKKAQLHKPYSLSLGQAIEAERAAICTLRTSKPKATKWRKDHNRTLESALAKANGTTEQAKQRNLNRIKTRCRQSRRIRRMNGKFQSSGLSTIKIIQDNGSIVTHTSKQGIEKGCAVQNI